jgi:hypothetical protein
VSNRISFRPASVRELAELEAENARLHKAAADLTAYLLTLQAALAERSGLPDHLGGRKDRAVSALSNRIRVTGC